MNNTADMSPAEIRIRLEDTIAALNEIGVPDMDTPAQRVRALGAELEKRVQRSEQVLGVAVGLQEEAMGSQMLASAAWKPYPEIEPPTNRDVLVARDLGHQVVVRWDAGVGEFYTSCGTRILITRVRCWRELVEGPSA